jgi:hypothetical protein
LACPSKTEQEQSCTEARMFGRLPSYGFYCRHVRDDVKALDLDGLRSAPIAFSQPQLRMVN